MIIIIFVFIVTVGVDQAHEAVGGLQPQIQILQHQRQKNLKQATGGERRETRESTKLLEREEVKRGMSIVGILEERGAQCIMGSPPLA